VKELLDIKPPFITSIEIAEIAGISHYSLKQAIHRLSESSNINLPCIDVIKSSSEDGRETEIVTYVFYGNIGKRDSVTLLSQIDLDVTATLEDRWSEIEKAFSNLKIAFGEYNVALSTKQVNPNDG
jgi:phage regulator Rha-like protein